MACSRTLNSYARLPSGARANAVACSIVDTANENRLYPLLPYLFDQLPNIDLKHTSAIEELLPWAELPNRLTNKGD